MPRNSLLLYDEICALCNGSIKFILKHEKSPYILFIPLQSEAGHYIIREYDIPKNADSVVFVETDGKNSRYYINSDVLISLAPYLKKFWTLLSGIRFIPQFIRDGLYKIIARIRYRIWGKLESCPLPSPEYKNRYLQSSEQLKAVLNNF